MRHKKYEMEVSELYLGEEQWVPLTKGERKKKIVCLCGRKSVTKVIYTQRKSTFPACYYQNGHTCGRCREPFYFFFSWIKYHVREKLIIKQMPINTMQ